MPTMTVERLRTAESAARKRLADERVAGDPEKRRKARKRVRRLQRKRRRITADAARRAGKAKAAAPAQDQAQGG